MGKYFVTLAKQVGYERTILLLGRHLRFQSLGIRMLTIITTKSNRYFFSEWQTQFLQHFSSIFHNKCSLQRLLPQPWQPPWLLEVHIPKGKLRPKRKKKKGEFLFYKSKIFCRWKPLPSSLKQRTKIKWCFNTGTTWSNPICGRGDFGKHVLNTLLLKSRTRRRGFHYYVQGQVSHTSCVTVWNSLFT